MNISAPNPFFVVGAQRSGTTMLRLMLNHHSRLCVPFESVFIPEFHERLDEYGDLAESTNLAKLVTDIAQHSFVERGALLPDPTAVLNARPASYADVVDTIFRSYAESQGKVRWGDKTPSYVTEIDVLRRLFPSCKVIHLVRDGRDVALSHSRTSWGSRHLPTVARDWSWKTTLARKMGGMLQDDYLEVDYETLVLNSASTLQTICDFLGEEFEEQMLDYHRDAEKKMPEKSKEWHRNSMSRPNADKVQEWKRNMPLSDRIIFDEIAGDTLESFGYERVTEQTLLSKLKRVYYSTVVRW